MKLSWCVAFAPTPTRSRLRYPLKFPRNKLVNESALFRTLIVTAVIAALLPTTVFAANWVRNPDQPSQWIDLSSRKHDDEVVRFDVSLSTDADSGVPSTAKDDLAIELLNCDSGKRVMMLPMLDNQTRHLPDLGTDDPLRRLICG
jgi:hypothetical protein